ncbi:MAG: hypothetical protein U0236_21310 [Nitrospira sp.]
MPDFSYPAVMGSAQSGDFTSVPDEMIPIPEVTFGSVTNRVAQVNLEGGSYFMRKAFLLNRLVLRINGLAGAPTGKILIYQAPEGEAGITNLVGSFSSFAVPGIGNLVLVPDQGNIYIKAGLIFILIGRDSALGSFTYPCWDPPFADLIAANVDPDTHPVYFTTLIAASAPNAPTFNPRQSPGGSAFGTFTSVMPVVRFKRL